MHLLPAPATQVLAITHFLLISDHPMHTHVAPYTRQQNAHFWRTPTNIPTAHAPVKARLAHGYAIRTCLPDQCSHPTTYQPQTRRFLICTSSQRLPHKCWQSRASSCFQIIPHTQTHTRTSQDRPVNRALNAYAAHPQLAMHQPMPQPVQGYAIRTCSPDQCSHPTTYHPPTRHCPICTSPQRLLNKYWQSRTSSYFQIIPHTRVAG